MKDLVGTVLVVRRDIVGGGRHGVAVCAGPDSRDVRRAKFLGLHLLIPGGFGRSRLGNGRWIRERERALQCLVELSINIFFTFVRPVTRAAIIPLDRLP
jgi:hypothetical protein